MSRADQLSVRIRSENLAEVVNLRTAEDLEDAPLRPQTLVMLSGGCEPAAEPEQLALSLFLLMPGGEA